MLLHVSVVWFRGAAGRNDDLDRYWEIASSRGRPYVDYQVEHAPLATLFFKGMSAATDDRQRFRRAVVCTMAVADLVTALALARGFGWASAVFYLVVTAPLLPLFYRRFDLLPTCAATLGLVALRAKKPALAACSFAVGIGFKLWPLPLTAFVVRTRDRTVSRRGVVALLLALTVLGLGWFLAGGLGGIHQVVTMRGATGWHLESTVGAIVAIRDHGSLRMESDAWRVGRTSRGVTLPLGLLAAVSSLWLAWRGASAERKWGTTWLASVTAMLLCSPVLSPQYMAWIAPGAAIALVENSRLPAALATGAVGLTVLLMREYDALMAGGIWALALLNMRNTALLLTFLAAAAVVLRKNGER